MVKRLVEAQKYPVRFRKGGQHIVINMKINILELRRLINEAIIDHMRLPKGPNSRDDDIEDYSLNDPFDPEEQKEKDRVELTRKTCHGAREA